MERVLTSSCQETPQRFWALLFPAPVKLMSSLRTHADHVFREPRPFEEARSCRFQRAIAAVILKSLC